MTLCRLAGCCVAFIVLTCIFTWIALAVSFMFTVLLCYDEVERRWARAVSKGRLP